MAMFVQSGSRGGGTRRRRRQMSEINVTPMVDVMLVLLVIFMVTAPLLTTGVDINLPKAQTAQISDPDNKAVTLSVAADGNVYLQQTLVPRENLVARMQSILKANPEARLYVRGDEQVSYGLVMEILGELHAAGFEKAALITQPPKASSR